jgi:elongator complex protein 3
MAEQTKARETAWLQARELTPEKIKLAQQALEEIRAGEKVFEAIRHNPLADGYLSKNILVTVYRELVRRGEWESDPALLSKIRMKPMRTLSGVTTVTVLTKPYPCPGECIFCPTDQRMPKSYLPDEPGAMRALHHQFDPYEQVAARLEALHAVGHPTDKIELLILGGTWSSYRKDYQAWFLRRCLEAMNGTDSRELEPEHRQFPRVDYAALEAAQTLNERAAHRNVGLVIETRPDHVTTQELAWLRRLGVTKVQMGAQSLDDHILEINKRGHTGAETHRAVALLRAAGFKIVLHWMPNLMGATLESDREDFSRLWDGLAPDEIKIYPTQLLENADLYAYWQRGEYHPYTTEQLVNLIADIKPTIPLYCRVNRVIRDIPSDNVVDGNKRTSLRQDVHRELKRRGQKCACIRCREVRGQKISADQVHMDDWIYQTDHAEEHFISWATSEDPKLGSRLVGYLRLSLPGPDSPETKMADLHGAAIIREVHIYGQSLQVGEEKEGAAQHAGLGTKLLEKADQIAMDRGFNRIAVISAIGTRVYYLDRGFKRGDWYLVKDLTH